MPRPFVLLLAVATLSAGAQAQTADAAGPGTSPNVTQTRQSQPAPIVRVPMGGPSPTITAQPIAGVWLLTDANSSAKTVSADAKRTEIRVDHGRANVQLRRPAENMEIVVDLPGGQTTLLKDGVYTFNAETNTVRVLHGEAQFIPGANAKPIKIKEEHELVLSAGPKPPKAVEADRRDLLADLLPTSRPPRGYGNAYGAYLGTYPGTYPGTAYGPGPYGDGYYGYPYYPAYPYYAYGYPWGWGYPYYGFGLGFGYYGGGFYGGRFGRR